MDSLITKPAHSIIVQSYHSTERDEPLNGDGFGVAWYVPEKEEDPALFRSVSPAWNNQNLLNISRVIESHCILAHVRAASPGLAVTQFNCHPFTWHNFSFMHNGIIESFHMIKRQLRNMLTIESYNWIQGSTDSETFFALFIDTYQQSQGKSTVEKMSQALLLTIKKIENLLKQEGVDGKCELNLVITDGLNAIATRYSSSNAPLNTLYLHTGASYSCDSGDIQLLPSSNEQTVLIASEPLTKDDSWHAVKPNYMVMIKNSQTIKVQPVLLPESV